MSIPDSVIVGRVLAGDVEGFSLLVDRYHSRCLRVATGLLGDSDDAEDAVQDAFLRAYRGLSGYRETERFGAWLLRIVVNQCRTHRSRGARHDSRHLGAPVDFDRLLEPINSAESSLDEAERRETLARALAQLPTDQREAVVLRFADGLSYDEMASVTGAGVSALKMRVQRACARLRTLLSEYLHA